MLNVDYDHRSDVLYLSKGKPVPCISEQEEDGLLLRISLETDEPVGVTILMYRKWAPYRAMLAKRIAQLLNLRVEDARNVLRSIDNENNA